jgi:hypothetical protein
VSWLSRKPSEPQPPKPPKPPKPAGRGGGGVAVIVALGTILLLSVVMLAFYTSYTSDATRQRLDALDSQLRDLSSNQQLIASELASVSSTSTRATGSFAKASKSGIATTPPSSFPVAVAPPASSQPKVSAAQAALGVRLVLGRVVKTGGATKSGLAVTFRPGGYYEGSIAFSVAASHGDVLKGSYYVDSSSTRTIDAHILSGADVSVFGWKGASSKKSSSIKTADLASVLVGGSDARRPWKDAWYWFQIGPGMSIIKVDQLPPL